MHLEKQNIYCITIQTIQNIFINLYVYHQVALGGLKDFHLQKNLRREVAGLSLLTEDTHEVCKSMRAASPPASAADLIEQQQQPKRSYRGGKRVSAILLPHSHLY